MPNDLILYQALQAMVDGLNDGAIVEFEIIAGNRAKYAGMLFDFDRVIGYAKDLRLIEYRVEDHYERDMARSRKTIYIYRYGTHPDDDQHIIKRRAGDPSGHWDRYFSKSQVDLLRSGASGNRSGEDNQGRGGNNLPSGNSETKLLGSPSQRSNRDPG
jgi:hypothetical protein